MDLPADWVVHPMEDFAISAPNYHGDLTLELMAQLRSMGWILDNFRFVLDGSASLDVSVDLSWVLPADHYRGWRLSQQFWPRDIAIRRNMVTMAWVSVTDSVASHDCDITDETGAGMTSGEFLRSLALLPWDGPTNASTRWAVVIGADGLLKLQWQALPLPASTLNGKATFKR
jgi:hypothetical protein